MSQAQHEVEVMSEKWWEEQALPPRKRAGYFEQLCDRADYLRKAAREDAMMQSWCTETEAKINQITGGKNANNRWKKCK